MKQRLLQLAILGGEPAFQQPLYVGRPNIGDRQELMKRIEDILDRRWLSNRGRYVLELEERLAQLSGTAHCVAACNGTIGLEIAIRAAELTGEVIVPSFTFIATAHALRWQEITPVFCDIDPLTHTIDLEHLETLITPQTTGIIGVHLWGQPCDIEGLTAIAQRHNLKLLFDAAHAFGCTYQGKPIGQFGDAEVFSFHATKFINAFEGGAVVTNNSELAHKMQLMKNFGFTGMDQVDYIGTNGKMNEVAAAMGLTSLESMDVFIAQNRQNYQLYGEQLANVPGLNLFKYDESEHCNYQYIVVEVNQAITGIHRDQLLEILQAEHIVARRYFFPGCHNMEPYRSEARYQNLSLPNTDRVCSQVLVLPTGSSIASDDIERICHILRFSIEHSQEIVSRLTS